MVMRFSILILKKMNIKINNYKLKKKGCFSIIHGDPVFTNLILNSNSKIVFIDPRRHIDHKYTIFGDKFYDYAKIFQSLNVYDFILHGKKIDQFYVDEIKKYFKQKFIASFGKSQFEYLRYLTCSLLISLQPFHDQKKNKDFIKICNYVLS